MVVASKQIPLCRQITGTYWLAAAVGAGVACNAGKSGLFGSCASIPR